jgi:Zn-dependent metalloprotease
MLASGVVYRELKFWSDQTKDYKIGICCLFVKHVSLRSMRNDRLARNRDNISEGVTCLPVDCCFSELAL